MVIRSEKVFGNICLKPEQLQDISQQKGNFRSPDGSLKMKKISSVKTQFLKESVKISRSKVPPAGSEKENLTRSGASSRGSEGKAACRGGACAQVGMSKGVEMPMKHSVVKRDRI